MYVSEYRFFLCCNIFYTLQFSPTSEHILLAYGRQHSSLLRTIFISGETRVPMYTVLEVYMVNLL